MESFLVLLIGLPFGSFQILYRAPTVDTVQRSSSRSGLMPSPDRSKPVAASEAPPGCVACDGGAGCSPGWARLVARATRAG